MRFPPPERFGPRPRRPALEAFREQLLRDIRREMRAELRIGLTRLYRHLRRDIRAAILEAKGLTPEKAKQEAEKEEEKEDETSLLNRIFGGLDIDMGDILKYGGAAVAGALAVLLITHIDDIYNFINQKKASGASLEEIKDELAKLIQEKLGGSQQTS
ncbi:MAG: hypothetical protein DRJ32_06320 [Thermoprotei archaeon]|nr:MAG: hypothetical protein DRJ32_06320 [Thermoprotei archaeon]